MNVFRDLLRIKKFREDRAELQVLHQRGLAQEAREAREDAEALLTKLLFDGVRIEDQAYQELCQRIVRLRQIEDAQQLVASLRQREALQHDVVRGALDSERLAEQALAEAREGLREATRQKNKFVELSANFELSQLRESERKEELELEEVASLRRDREDWDAHDPQEALP
jgi:type III secretion protein O